MLSFMVLRELCCAVLRCAIQCVSVRYVELAHSLKLSVVGCRHHRGGVLYGVLSQLQSPTSAQASGGCQGLWNAEDDCNSWRTALYCSWHCCFNTALCLHCHVYIRICVLYKRARLPFLSSTHGFQKHECLYRLILRKGCFGILTLCCCVC